MKYNCYTNLSELKYNLNSNDLKEIFNMEKAILFQHFTVFQHFYIKSLQFTITIPFKNTFIYYEPFQTPHFLKLTWKTKMNNNPITKYHGYMLSANKLSINKIPSNVFKCEDGSYIDELSVCDRENDCRGIG